MTYDELIASMFGIIFIVLMIKRNPWSWITGNISVAIQAYSFYRVRLYADMGLQIVYFVVGVYGFVLWMNQRVEADFVIRFLNQKDKIILGTCGILFAVILALILDSFTDAVIPYIDATLASGSLIATYLQARKNMENWPLWILLNCSYGVLYATRGLWMYSALSVIFGIFAIIGWKEWKRYKFSKQELQTIVL